MHPRAPVVRPAPDSDVEKKMGSNSPNRTTRKSSSSETVFVAGPTEGLVVVDATQLVLRNGTRALEGRDFSDANASVILVEMPPGQGVGLHRHPYAEIFIIHEGEATFTVGTASVRLRALQLAFVSALVPHKFVNSGHIPLRQTDVHLNDRFVTDWLGVDPLDLGPTVGGV